MQCTILQPKQTTRNAFLPADYGAGVPTSANIGTLLRRATNPDHVGSWPYGSQVVHLYGYKTGKAGTENKHELPPPHDNVLLFGEAVLVGMEHGAVVNFNSESYKTFYNTIMGGFDDVEEMASEAGVDVFSPLNILKGQTQLTRSVEDANLTRECTKMRWVVKV
jgi:hypothetical protein